MDSTPYVTIPVNWRKLVPSASWRLVLNELFGQGIQSAVERNGASGAQPTFSQMWARHGI